MPHDRKNYNKMQCLILTPIYSHTALPQALDDLIGSECFANHGWSDSPSYTIDRKSTRLNSSHLVISYAVFCLKKKKKKNTECQDSGRNDQKHACASQHRYW